MLPTKIQFIPYALQAMPLKVFWHDNNDFRMLETVLAKHCILDNNI